MAAKEERTYRNLSKKLTKNEAQGHLLEGLLTHGVGLREVEEDIRREAKQLKGGGRYKGRNEIIRVKMREKIKDNHLVAVKLRRKRNLAKGKLETSVGAKSKVCRRIIREVKAYSTELRFKLSEENEEKINFLVQKYGEVKDDLSELTSEEASKYASCAIFMKKCELVAKALKGPVVVCEDGEEMNLTKEETEVHSLGPKFCILNDLKEEEFENNLEQALIKYKWEVMGEEIKKKKTCGEDPADVAIDAILDENEKNEVEEQLRILEAKSRMVYDSGDGGWSYARKRVTDFKGNTRVIFPRKCGDKDMEGKLEMMRLEVLAAYKGYVMGNFGDRGDQKSNLTASQLRGLKSLKKKMKDGSVVILPTDKSGRFAVMSVATYIKAGE